MSLHRWASILDFLLLISDSNKIIVHIINFHNQTACLHTTITGITLQKIPFGNLQYWEIYMICTVFFACLYREKKFPLSIWEIFWKFYFPVLAWKFTLKSLKFPENILEIGELSKTTTRCLWIFFLYLSYV